MFAPQTAARATATNNLCQPIQAHRPTVAYSSRYASGLAVASTTPLGATMPYETRTHPMAAQRPKRESLLSYLPIKQRVDNLVFVESDPCKLLGSHEPIFRLIFSFAWPIV